MKYLTAAVVTACLSFSAFSLFDLSGALEPPARSDLPTGTPIAKAGEWVTNPDGTKVCRLVHNVVVGGFMNVSSCADWVDEMPKFGQAVPYLRSNRGFGQIHIEGEWRP